MSVGSLGGIVGSAAGAPMSQTAGTEAERAQRDSAVQQRGQDTAQRAEQAAGIGTTDQDQEASERDADGRRPWEAPPDKKNTKQEAKPSDATAVEPRQSKDATGQSGKHLDLTG